MHIVVVGGGIFGVTSAVELKQRGHEVTLLDRSDLPHDQAASWDISKLVRMDYGYDEEYMELMEEVRLRSSQSMLFSVLHSCLVLLRSQGLFSTKTCEIFHLVSIIQSKASVFRHVWDLLPPLYLIDLMR